MGVFVESVAVAAAAVFGSSLTYWFTLRTARREREFDTKAREYKHLLLALDGLNDALLAQRSLATYIPSKDPDELIAAFAPTGSVIPPERLLLVQKSIEKIRERLRKPTSKRSRDAVQELRELFVTELAFAMSVEQRKFNEALVSLQVIQSPALESQEYKALANGIGLIGKSTIALMSERVGAQGAEDEVHVAASVAADDLQRLVKDFRKVIQAEVGDVLP